MNSRTVCIARRRMGLAACLAAFAAQPALADVKAGVDAWSRGEYASAVREWQAPAQAGDPDALFNLAQAYRLGRGVTQDEARAEQLYAQAAEKGHLRAADTYGLILFQDPARRAQAVPYVADAARRGDPRAQYLLGIAHFNGDTVERDWVRAYALLTLANGQGLPQAAGALGQMDGHVPLEQRQEAQLLAGQLQAEAQSARARELVSADLAVSSAAPQPAPAASAATQASPAAASARAALADATRATGAESPASAGADFARPATPAAPLRASSQPAAAAVPPRAPAAGASSSRPAPAPASAAASSPWRVQLGAFSVRGNAEGLWNRLSRRPELAGKTRVLEPAGSTTRLLAAGFADKAQADAACRALKAAGQDCLVTSR